MNILHIIKSNKPHENIILIKSTIEYDLNDVFKIIDQEKNYYFEITYIKFFPGLDEYEYTLTNFGYYNKLSNVHKLYKFNTNIIKVEDKEEIKKINETRNYC